MSYRFLVAAALALAACQSPEGGAIPQDGPFTPAAVSAAPSAAFLNQTASGGEERLVNIMDGCDPASFPVTCIRQGGVTFPKFLDLLGKHQTMGAWHFAPGTLEARVGQTLLAINHGGEVHTFTEVKEFGGGIIPILNQLSGNPVPAQECQNLAAGDFVAPGATDTDEVEAPGTEHYQCCIHPWMRLDVHARS